MSDQPDLVELAGGPMLTPAQRRAMQKRVGKPVSKAYAAAPGSGPAGETCKTCKHIARTHAGAARTYRKCDLMRDHWSHGPGTDIRAGAPACSRWEVGEKGSAVPILPPPTLMERDQARIAARALALAMEDRASIQVDTRLHIDYARPRGSEWITTYKGLPGFSCVNGQFRHALLPGWTYTSPEVVTEMIPDLQALADRGERPTQATS